MNGKSHVVEFVGQQVRNDGVCACRKARLDRRQCVYTPPRACEPQLEICFVYNSLAIKLQ